MLISGEYIDVHPPDLADTLQISGIADMTKTEIVVNKRLNDNNDPSWLEGTGSMEGIDLNGNQFLMDFIINLSHNAWIDAQNNIHIGKGKFGISGNNGDDYLQGEYTGGGRDEGPETKISLNLLITGGAGKFQLAKGALSAVLTSQYENKDGIRINYRGMVLVPENEPYDNNE